MNLINITKISRYCGFFIALLVLAVVIPTAGAQDFRYFELGPKPPNIVPDGWLGNENARTTEDPPTVWMPDANLRAAVEATLNTLNPPLTLTKTNLSVLRSIDADGKDKSPITNLTGLEYATNLTWLNLKVNNITSLTPLSGLTNLTDLDLSENNITNLTLLSAFVNLERLSLSSNSTNEVSINDISALSGLTNMRRLELSWNAITDISVLSQLTSLTHLYISSNNVSNISVLSNFSDLEHFIFYNNTHDSLTALDITVLADLTNLIILNLGKNNITDFSILSGLTNLEVLELSSNNIDDDDITDYLSGMTHLKGLHLKDNDITEISNLSGMVNLEALVLSENNITDISHLSGMVNMKVLVLTGNNITDISHLSGMVNMRELYLRDNNIPTIGVLVDLDSLERVNLTANPVWDILTNRDTLATLYERSVEVLIDDLVPRSEQPREIEPGVSFTVPSLPQNGPFDVSVIFTEEVYGFEQTELVLDPTTIASITSESFTITDNNTTYTATITPTNSGILTFSVAAGVARNAAYILNTAATSEPVTIDKVAPQVSITVPSETQNAPFEVSVVFTEEVSDFFQEDLTLDGTGTANITDFDTTDDITYTVEITPVIDGDITFSVAAGAATDTAGNENTAATTQTVSVDLPPNVSFTVPSDPQNGVFTVSVVFTESVSGFEQTELDLDPTTIASITSESFTITDNNTTYTATITPTNSGVLTFSVAAGVATDAAYNLNTAATSEPVTIDMDPPEVSLTVPSGVQNAAFEVTFTFTEPISGFEASDVVLNDLSAEITEPQQDSANEKLYTVTITPSNTLPSNITIDIPVDAVKDEAGNGSVAATTLTVAVDLPPQVSFDVPSGTQYGAFAVKIIFSEPVSTFIADDLILRGTATAEIFPLSGSTSSVYNVRITPTSKGDLTITLPAEYANDTGNNWNSATTSDPVSVDLEFVIEFPDANLASALRSKFDLTADADISNSQIASMTVFELDPPHPPSTRITDLTGLEHATNLTTLSLRGNRISDITVLENLTNLTELNLRGNRISDITVLENLTNLTELRLINNEITDVNALSTLTTLTKLFIRGNSILDTSPLYPLTQGSLRRVDIIVSQYPPWDVNEDGSVDDTDSGLVTAAIGQTGANITDPRTDVDGDGDVDADDLLLVTENIDGTIPAPLGAGNIGNLFDTVALETLDRDVIKAQLDILHANSDGSAKYLRAIAMLENILAASRPKETTLLANYPNPFNPETWIPYHLAHASKVRITIYDVGGMVVRQVDLGHQQEGYYTNRSRAAYWDGRNDLGERVASGIYFYQLEADHLSLLRKMVILK